MGLAGITPVQLVKWAASGGGALFRLAGSHLPGVPDWSISECKKVWGDYSGSGLECDEYPFASTKEGSTKGDNRFSVRLIDGPDNRKGGERLNEMYTLNRMLDGDPFYVKITD
ncbi:NucA/NucB deoxyribonuclease domain-containing protein [Streptomyces collinus]